MKNNIGYKGNTNNTSVIIFLNQKVKNSQRWYFAWENLRGGFCCIFILFLIFILLLYLHFIFVSSFHFIFDLHFVVVVLRLPMFFNHICFSTSSLNLLFDIIPHRSVDYRRVFTPILYFQSSPSQSGSRHFHFQLFRDLFTANATVLSGRFLPAGVFYLSLLHRHF